MSDVETLRSTQSLGIWYSFLRWFDSWAGLELTKSDGPPKVDWIRSVPFIMLHLMCLGVLWVGWSWTAVAVTIAFYYIRMFAITGWYHRYFSHRTFKTSRTVQFLFALLGGTCTQRGPLWWAGHHRHHHIASDTPEDVHSPRQGGFFWSHMGWIMSQTFYAPRLKSIADFAKFPELRFLDRYDVLVPTLTGFAMFGFGKLLEAYAPELGTNGPQMLIWGFFISTVALFHGTCTINSLSHVYGSQRYETGDDSRNNFFLALITMGEGWHNNHHYYPASTRQGFYWWEIDMTYYCLKGLEWLGLIWDIRDVPTYVRDGKTRQDSDRSVLKKKIEAAVKAAELPTPQPQLELTPP
ncbi:MAG: acyl-CoA desaturase [Nitrospira sp.]|nr:acyl-CoA desaturase [Nitrospira sp.]MDH4303798.1 acyl-CoA desaturase [Nitrospira sp.]MDH5193661.1 acyl-CoA desaturase [Nitrospira sp.]